MYIWMITNHYILEIYDWSSWTCYWRYFVKIVQKSFWNFVEETSLSKVAGGYRWMSIPFWMTLCSWVQTPGPGITQRCSGEPTSRRLSSGWGLQRVSQRESKLLEMKTIRTTVARGSKSSNYKCELYFSQAFWSYGSVQVRIYLRLFIIH